MTFVATAIIDLRRDHEGMVTPDGDLVNGFANVSRVIDRVADTGFTHITFAVNAPIDIQTGLIGLFDPNAPVDDRDKGLARDLWRLVDYAKSKELGVYINPHVVDHTNDYFITQDTPFGPEFSFDRMFDSLAEYLGQLGNKAQSHGVDGIYIGGANHGLVSESFRPQWQKVIDAVRDNYSGNLLHNYFYTADSVLWDMVDVNSLWILSTLSRQALTDVNDIYQEYFGVDADTPRAVVDVIREHIALYGKSVIIEHGPINAGDTFVGDNFQLISFYETGSVDTTLFSINHGMQAARHAASIKLVKEEFAGSVGISVSEYAPWQMADWLVDPRNADNPWQIYSNLGFNILRSPRAEKWIGVALNDGDFIEVRATHGVANIKSVKKSAGVNASEQDLLDFGLLENDLGIDLWWSAKAPTKRVDATGAVWTKKNLVYVSTDRDNAAEWAVKITGVKALAADDVWLG